MEPGLMVRWHINSDPECRRKRHGAHIRKIPTWQLLLLVQAVHSPLMAPVIPETTTPNGRHDKQLKKPTVVIYAPPGMVSHLVSTVELGKLFAEHGLKIIIVLGGQADDHKATAAGSFQGVTAANPELSVHRLPQVPRSRHAPAQEDHVARIFELARASNPDLRDFLRATSPAALILDFFCGSAVDLGAELGIPTYIFFTSCVTSLAHLLHLPVIHGRTTTSTRDLGSGLVHVSGIPPIPADHLAAAQLDRNSLANQHFLALSKQLCSCQGVIVNSFRSLEPRAVDASPPGDNDANQPDPDLDALLPEGFLARTKDSGLVVKSWAPQREVLAHGAVGGFVTHCDWNSVLEAVVGGVPMLAWPMYAEQRMNKVFLVEETKLAVAVDGYDKEMVQGEKVAAKVKWLMESDGGAELREKTREAMRRAKETPSDGGESKMAVLKLARKWRNGYVNP